MGLDRASPHIDRFQKVFAHQVRQLAPHSAYAEIDAGLAKVNRLELRMAVCHVQKRHVAKLWDVVQRVGCRGGVGQRVLAQCHAGHGARTQHL